MMSEAVTFTIYAGSYWIFLGFFNFQCSAISYILYLDNSSKMPIFHSDVNISSAAHFFFKSKAYANSVGK